MENNFFESELELADENTDTPAVQDDGASFSPAARAKRTSEQSKENSEPVLAPCLIDRPLRDDELSNEYGVRVLTVQHGTHPPEFFAYYGGLQILSSKEKLSPARLREAGICKTEDLTDGRANVQSNYIAYLQKNYGLQVITLQSPRGTSYSVYGANGLLAHSASLKDLQTKLKDKDIQPKENVPSPEKITITPLPDGKVSISFPDSSEVILGADDKVVEWKNSQGIRFTKTTDGPPAEWSNGKDKWQGTADFKRGTFTFSFAQGDNRLSLKESGNGKTEVQLRPGTDPGSSQGAATVIYERGKTVSFSDERGQIVMAPNGDIKLLSTDGKTVREVKSKDGVFHHDGKPLEGDDAITFNQRMALMHQRLGNYKECLAHHEVALAQIERNSRPTDAGLLEYHLLLKQLANLVGDEASAQRHEKEATEIQRVLTYNQTRLGAADDIDRAKVVYQQLPEQIGISADKDSLKVSSSDIQQLIKSIPDLRLKAGTNLEKLRSVSIERGQLRCSGEASLVVPDPKGGADLVINIEDLKTDVKPVANDQSALKLTNIEGLNANVGFIPVDVKELTVKLKGEPPSQELEIAIDKYKLPKDFALFENTPQKPITIPLKDAGAVFAGTLQKLIQRLATGADLREGATDLSAAFVDPSIAQLFKNVKGLEKQGDRLQITTDGESRSFGGLPLALDKMVAGKIGSTANGGTEITDVQGLAVNLNLPKPVEEALGLKDHPQIRRITLDRVQDENGTRVAAVQLDGPVRSLELKVGPDLSPKCDANGNILVTANTANGEKFELTLNAKQLQDGIRPADLNFKITPSGANRSPFKTTGLHPSLSSLWGGIDSMEKSADKYTINMKSDMAATIGGVPAITDKTTSLKITVDGDKAEVSDIQGMKIRMPIPPDVADSLGMHNPLELAVKGLSISAADASGNRSVVVIMDGAVEQVELVVGPDMKPVADANKNVATRFVLKNNGQRVPLELQFNPDQVTAGTDPRKIDFKLSVKENCEHVPTVLEGFFKHELDPKLKEMLSGVEYIERRGDQLHVRRKAESTHEIGGLKVTAGKELSFRINPNANGIQLSDIRGIAITELPGEANKIYSTRLPIELSTFSLSNVAPDGNRFLEITSPRTLRSARVLLNASLTPLDIDVEVENPVQALKEKYGLHDGLATRTGTGTFKIHIHGDGRVDMTSVRIAEMLADAGNLTSTGGVLSAGAAYVANPSQGGQTIVTAFNNSIPRFP